MYINEIKQLLSLKAEEKYCKFSSKLINNSSLPILGIRMPELKKIATEIYKSGHSEEFFSQCDFSSVELCLLYSYLLSKQKCEIKELLFLFDKAAAHVDNWCTCDILCQSFKQCQKHRERVFEHLIDYLESGKTYYMRIAVVMLMSHFLTEKYTEKIFDILNKYCNDDYYYNMAVAWCVATAMAKFREKTYLFLKDCELDNWTYNKAIQKMLESYRVSDADKKILRGMKRKK